MECLNLSFNDTAESELRERLLLLDDLWLGGELQADTVIQRRSILAIHDGFLSDRNSTEFY